MKTISNKTFDAEREFYGSCDIQMDNCRFDGPADGESAFKECNNIAVKDCFFNLRYPFWHTCGVAMDSCVLTDLCRAALWYSNNISVRDSKLLGIKALRECRDISISHSDIESPEFGWLSKNIRIEQSKAKGEYFMFRAENLEFNDVSLLGKYSFQYIKNSTFENCTFDTKDAFWHAENVLVKNSVIKGEYLGWYCSDVTFENCVIEGTQPLCYCKGLKLINCKMIGADLAFEKSDVMAHICSDIISIKNPSSGYIHAPSVGEIILDAPSNCDIKIGEKAL